MRKLPTDKEWGVRFGAFLDRLVAACGPKENLYSWTRRIEGERVRGLYEKVKRWRAGQLPEPHALLAFLASAHVKDAGLVAAHLRTGGFGPSWLEDASTHPAGRRLARRGHALAWCGGATATA